MKFLGWRKQIFTTSEICTKNWKSNFTKKNWFYLHLFLCNHSTVYSVQYNIKKHYTDLTGNPCKTQVFVVNLALYIYTRTELGLNVNFPGATVQLHLAPKGTKKQFKNNIRIGSSLFTACLQARRPVGQCDKIRTSNFCYIYIILLMHLASDSSDKVFSKKASISRRYSFKKFKSLAPRSTIFWLR